MKTRYKLFLLISLAFNVGVGFHLLSKQVTTSGEDQNNDSPKLASGHAIQAVKVVESTVTNTVALDWRSVESSDYKQYIANLKSIGCPWITIKDMIIADVNRLYAPKIAALQVPRKQHNYWEPSPRGPRTEEIERTRKVQGLLKEKKALIRELLGIDLGEESEAMSGFANHQDSRYDFLPEAKKDAVAEIHSRFQAQIAELFGRSGGYQFQDDRVQRKLVNEQMRTELSKVLTPDELKEFDLRLSNTATQLRYNMAGFEPTEDEFRKIFEARQTFDEKYGPDGGIIDRNDPIARAEMERAKKEMEEQIRVALGPERSADYTRGQDFQYQLLDRIAKRFDSPPDAAAQAYEMRRSVDQEVRKLRGNKELTTAQRSEALAAVRAETERSFKQVLGEAGYRNYRAWDRSWFESLGK